MRISRCLLLCFFVLAAFSGGGAAKGDAPADAAGNDYPVVVDSPWAGAAVIGIAGFFLAGLVIGPAVRLHAPPTHAHDEPPGTSGHHGRSGTV